MNNALVRSGDYLVRAREIAIHVGLLALLAAACFAIVRPFVALIAWGVIIAIAAYPAFRKLTKLLGGRSTVSAVIYTLVLLAVLIIPIVLVAGSLVDGVQGFAQKFKAGAPVIPPPPPAVESWPVIGVPLKGAWDLASRNLSSVLRNFAPQIRAFIPQLFVASAGIGFAVLQCILAIIVSGLLLAGAEKGAGFAASMSNRLFGARGPEFLQMSAATVRSVTTGILGVALIQSLFAMVGFLAVGMPAAGLWSVIFLCGALLQLGGPTLIPAVIYVFATASTTKAVLFLLWALFVGLMDNVLKPLLLGRGVEVPMAIVFLGAIGGFIAMGAIGLFVGAIVLSVGYKLLTAWLEVPQVTELQVSDQKAVAAS